MSQHDLDYIAPLETLSMQDVPHVGGKNASLGEMIGALSGLGVAVPGGFATTAKAFWDTLRERSKLGRAARPANSISPKLPRCTRSWNPARCAWRFGGFAIRSLL